MIRLVNQRKSVAIKAVLDRFKRETAQVKVQQSKEINGRDAVFDRHSVPTLENHGLTASQQHQSGEWINRCCSGPAIEWHPETHRRSLIVATGDHRSKLPVCVEHSRQLLGLRPSDSMGDQEGSDLCRAGFRLKHQLKCIGRFRAAHALARVLAAADFAQMLLEALLTTGEGAGQEPFRN